MSDAEQRLMPGPQGKTPHFYEVDRGVKTESYITAVSRNPVPPINPPPPKGVSYSKVNDDVAVERDGNAAPVPPEGSSSGLTEEELEKYRDDPMWKTTVWPSPFLISDNFSNAVRNYDQMDPAIGTNQLADKAINEIHDKEICHKNEGTVATCVHEILSDILLFHTNNPSVWPQWEFGNQYVSRVASRVESRAHAELLLMLQLILPGTNNFYYGDELGMKNLPDDSVVYIGAFNFSPNTVNLPLTDAPNGQHLEKSQIVTTTSNVERFYPRQTVDFSSKNVELHKEEGIVFRYVT
ncbi:hypothetical protein NECAME_14442 [Necator americanus]|uniref:Uncharacterized protein n=1 Tax=Necator americanus TaxID=51031 RepID=W2SMT3_NECAM|nr:hypothetical protein NECAME_14442 [Necator americanus]ETN70955.1 hypothetical protein NECAME_14442 [Necator americanus]